MPNVLIAGGGSGGHVAPAIAVAEALHALGCTPTLAHSGRDVDLEMAEQTPFKHVSLPAMPFSLKPKMLFAFYNGFKQTETQVKQLIKSENIQCILSTGGFVAAPALRAGKNSNCPTLMLNLDNPPGKANRLAVRWSDQNFSTIQCAFKDYTLIPPPLRDCVLATATKEKCYRTFGLQPRRMTLLVTGASQGASSINAFIPQLVKSNPAFFNGWQILHIAGTVHEKEVKELWSDVQIPYRVEGFVQEMGLAWGIADLAVTRGGANTIAEIAMNAVPAIVLPYPYHRDEHQRLNAKKLEAYGGVCIERDFVQISKNIVHAGQTICKLLRDHEQRFHMQQALISASPENGASSIANACMALMKD